MEESTYQQPNGGNKQQSAEQGFADLHRPENGLSTLIGKQVNLLKEGYGEPSRIEPSSYGYDWWIYNNDEKHYMQVGVENGKIETLYAIGENVDISPFKIGQSVEEIFSKVLIETDMNFEYEGTSYRFEMTEEDMNSRPLIKMDDIFLQLYIDKFTGALSSVRYLTKKTLITQRPYELVYNGELLEAQPVPDESWTRIDEGSKQQIFDITNIMRKRYNLKRLKWDQDLANIAYVNSKFMYEKDTLPEQEKQNEELSYRLSNANIQFEIADENIAANYIDAPAVMEGWLNSERHRKNLLNNKFTYIGVGVYHKDYTQNFIRKNE